MAHLSIGLLGPFQVTLDGQPLTTFASDKVRALLAYLALETGGPQRREKLAGLLWPDWPERSARANLRRALANLRQVIGDPQATPPFLLVSRQTIQFNDASDAQVDVTAFIQLLQAQTIPAQAIPQLEEAVALYRGGFLDGFSLADSAAFEEWALLQRERLHRLVMGSLHRLAACHAERGEYEAALPHAWRQVELDPWREKANRQLMRLLALSDQRGAALAQYETLYRLLSEELGVEPAAKTTQLYEQIRAGEPITPVRLPDIFIQPPSFMDEEEPLQVERPVFVARERELARLEAYLDAALAGQGQVVFVTGSAGRGKTALVEEFARRAQDAQPDLLVAGGNGNAHTGVGDPYLPFREVLGLLTGDVEARWAAGALSREHARRLWHALSLAAQAVVEAGPDLVDTFLPGAALLGRARAYAPGGAGWLPPLEELVGRKAALPPDPNLQQSALFQQYTRVLGVLARQRPLLLLLDDLQWADLGSVNLLFHLGRGLAGNRILIVGAYRPEEIATGRGRERHPLAPVVSEFKRDWGDVEVTLDRAEDRSFVEAFLDTEPNRLSAAFHETLLYQTGGHPLFTVELLRGMQERGDLVQDAAGRWVEGPALDWKTLPARVEAVIAERVGRLDAPLRETLRVACVEGEIFTAEVLAQVQAGDERDVVGRLSRELARRHRLVHAQAIQRLGTGRLSHYRFRHILFQNYLYHHLDKVERAHLHEAVGTALETLYGGGAEGTAIIAPQLARHFQQAGLTDKAIGYLRQAGERAVQMTANEEAVGHFSQALALLKTLPDTPERAERELMLQLGLATPLWTLRGFGHPELGGIVARTRELVEQMGEMPQLFPALYFANSFYGARAEFQAAREIGEQMLAIAERAGDSGMMIIAHWSLSWILWHTGEFASSLSHAERAIDLYDPQQHHVLLFLYGGDPGVKCLDHAAHALVYLGYPDQALKRSLEARTLAQELSDPMSLSTTHWMASAIHINRREWQAALEHAEASVSLSTQHGFTSFLMWATHFRGWALAELEQVEEGKTQMRQGLAGSLAAGFEIVQTPFLTALAAACGKAGQIEEGLALLAEALAFAVRTGERCYEAEIHRLKGELLLMRTEAEVEAEVCFRQAIEVARQLSAKLFELRATMSLCRLWQKQGKVDEARQMLEEIYGWFTEGFDTLDLQEASGLLEELSRD